MDWFLYDNSLHHERVNMVYLLTTGNYKSAIGQLQNSRILQNNSVNSAILITINSMIKCLKFYADS